MNILSPSFESVIRSNTTDYFSLLVPEHVVSRVGTVSQFFPKHLSSFWGYESHLSHDEVKTDFLFCVEEPTSLDALMRQKNQPLQFPLKRFSDFVDQWSSKTSFLSSSIANFWFEIDQEDLLKDSIPCSFFFAPSGVTSALALTDLTSEVLSFDQPEALPLQTLKNLFKVAECIPDHAEIVQIGQMKARNETGLRLFIQGLNRLDLGLLLREMGYPYPLQEIWSIYDEVVRHKGKIEVNIDLMPELGPKLGLETYFTEWSDAKSYLLHPSHTKYLSTDAVSSVIKTVDGFAKCTSKLSPFFSHFKLNYSPGSPTSMKAYLAFSDPDKTPLARRTPLTKLKP